MKRSERFCRAVALFLSILLIMGFTACDDEKNSNGDIATELGDIRKYYLFETDILAENGFDDISGKYVFVRNRSVVLGYKDYVDMITTYPNTTENGSFVSKRTQYGMLEKYDRINLDSEEASETAIFFYMSRNLGIGLDKYGLSTRQKFDLMSDGKIASLSSTAHETQENKIKNSDGTTSTSWTQIGREVDYIISIWDGEKAVWGVKISEDEFGLDFSEIPSMVTDDEGRVFLHFANQRAIVIAEKGKSARLVEAPTGESGFRDSLNIRDGKPIFCRTDAGANGVTHTIYTLDCENGSFDDGVELTAEKGSTAFIIIDGYAIGYRNAQGVFGVNEKSESTMIFSWIDVGLTSAMVGNIWSIGNDEFFITYNDSIDKRTHSGIIKKSSEEEYRAFKVERREKLAFKGEEVSSGEDSSEKTIRVVAEPMSNVNSLAYELIQRFNRKNLDYKVKIETVDGDYESIASNLMKKMLSGDVPDVVMFGNLLRSGNFKKQNMFVDLYPFMDADKEHGRDTYLPCVLEPFEEGDGTLQLLTTEFSMNTLIGSTDTLGEIKEWTFDEMLDYAENLDGVALAYLGIPSSWSASKGFLHRMSYALLNEFIDFDGKVCNFTDGRFARLLETAKNSLFSVGTTSVADLRGIYDGEIALTLASLTGPAEYMYATGCTYFGREAVIVGYPHDENGCGTIVFPKTQLGITKSCEDKDAAWKLLSFFNDSQVDLWNGILEDPSNFKDQETFPCTKKAAEAMIDVSKQMYAMMMVIESKNPITGAASRSVTKTAGEKFVEKITINEDGEEVIEIVESDYADPVKRAMAVNSLAGDGDGMCFYSTFDDDDAEVLWKIFNECNTVYGTNAAAVNIIVDEAEAYFSGGRSIDDVVKMVQDRVTTQINE